MIARGFALGAFLLLGLTRAATAQTPPPLPQPDGSCKLHHASEEVSSFAQMPKPVIAFVLSKMGADGSRTTEVMADRGAYFNATDVIMGTAPGRRFIRAGHAGNKWFVWYERGGIAYSKSIAIVSLNDGKTALVAHIGYEHENPCTLTDAALNGKTAPDNGLSNWW